MKTFESFYKGLLITALTLLSFQYAFGQLILDAEVRPRAEYRHGFGTLMPDSTDPALFIQQRTRFNAGYNKDKVKLYVSLQDVRVWGDTRTLNASDNNGLMIHQAWGQYQFGKVFALKVGRQVFSYDDQRILGGVDWAQQARSHDALLGVFTFNKFSFDLAAAYNQDGPGLTGNTYTTAPNYKVMEYLWANYKAESWKLSILALNNGLQYIDQNNSDNNAVRYSQTFGAHFNGRIINFIDILANVYYTGGKDVANRSLSALNFALDVNFKPESGKWNAGLGGEFISGNDLNWDSSSDENKAFNPFYGTNHKFNGFMDYFYVGGRHVNSVGLVDLYVRGGLKVGKSKFLLFVHNFMSDGEMIVGNETMSSQLGTELDFVYVLKLTDVFNIKAGYSQMFAAESMGYLKSGNYENTNNWGWVMLTFKPQLLKHEYAEKKEL